jgi:hypothetical protein
MLQSGMGIVEDVSLEVTAVVSHHQLIVQHPDTRLKVLVLLMELPATLLNVLDGAVLGLHLVGVVLQAEVLVGASHRDLLEHGAHMLVTTSRMTDTQPLPHDRDCPQASLVLSAWVQDSHHPTR